MRFFLLNIFLFLAAVHINITALGQPIKRFETQVNTFKLLDAASLSKYTFQIDKQRNRLKDNPEDWEDIIFTNRDHTSHIRLIHHPGDAPYEMAGFEIRQGIPDADETHYATLPDKVFMTPNGIMIGLKENEVADIHGKPHDVFQDGDHKVYRYYEHNPKSWIFRNNKKTGYLIQFWFLDSVLVRYCFGYEYP